MFILACSGKGNRGDISVKNDTFAPFLWENATVYFLLTDRFCNGEPSNDKPLGREQDGAPLRSFMGGDIQGVTLKIEAGYFDELGVNAIWITPPVEQIHGFTDEGWGKTYGYHGYWARDWTNIDPNYGTMDDLHAMIEKAHEHGIRVLLDVVLNHTGPVTPLDSQWPDEWVRTSPQCTHQSYETSVPCALVKNLPDIRTDSYIEVELPDFLIEKWKSEGRYEREIKELDQFFKRTGYPRLPRYYIIKWLTDYVREMGVDGFRVDTAKHLEAYIWEELYGEANRALLEWKEAHPGKKLDDLQFYMVGEVYGYGIQGGFYYNYGDTSVNFYEHQFKALINFSFKSDAVKNPEEIYSEYSSILNGTLKDFSIMNYISSHDDEGPFDLNREKVMESATKLLLAPGAVQIYYGDEIARPLTVEGTKGDAHLRSFMNWEDLENNSIREGHATRSVLEHWQKIGRFRKEHPAVGAGEHHMISKDPYVFMRTLDRKGLSDKVLIVMDQYDGPLDVSKGFPDGTRLKDYYSGEMYTVKGGSVNVSSTQQLYLFGVED